MRLQGDGRITMLHQAIEIELKSLIKLRYVASVVLHDKDNNTYRENEISGIVDRAFLVAAARAWNSLPRQQSLLRQPCIHSVEP